MSESNEPPSESPETPADAPSADAPPSAQTPSQETAPVPSQALTYARGLLQIRVPVLVKLAAQRKNIREIIELGPGSIVSFDKTCEEALELCVGDRAVATGEVVKVGDKFGLRIQQLIGS